ncbi:hypothetical protein O181_126680, partial [Austropuccinia psidii MF-1]|nr:hypothetical protein [Austropuccinia psidii MF-1]
MEELPSTNAEIVITQHTGSGISAIEKQNIDEIVSMALQKQSDFYSEKIRALEETIHKFQIPKETKTDLPQKNMASRGQQQQSTPQVKLKVAKSVKKATQTTPARKMKNHQIRKEEFPPDFKSVK